VPAIECGAGFVDDPARLVAVRAVGSALTVVPPLGIQRADGLSGAAVALFGRTAARTAARPAGAFIYGSFMLWVT
jgi:hypothetical protein